MRRLVFGAATVGMMFGSLTLVACFDFGEDCRAGEDPCDGAGGSSSTTTMNGGGGAGGGNPDCVPAVGEMIPAGCGVFVRPASGDDTANGDQGSPVKTLEAAVALAESGESIYLCGTDTNTLAQSLVLPAGVGLHGGMDCTDWTVTAADRATIQGPGGMPAVTVSPGGAVGISGVSIRSGHGTSNAPNAQGLFVDGASVTMWNSEVVAGDGFVGEDGLAFAGAAMMGIAGDNGGGCDVAGNGGDGPMNSCSYDSGMSQPTGGGNGAEGSLDIGQTPGAKGTPGARNNAGIFSGNCDATDGSINGDPGMSGDPAVALNESPTVISGGGLVLPAGVDGTHGDVGQGGGGGAGGPKGTCGMRGPGGGSGGTGGCGGNGGKGGGHGGWSVAVLANGTAIITFGGNVTLTSGNGGNGGQGEAGQSGGGGGMQGIQGASGACPGGVGGNGGDGGNGVSGNGGSSIGVVLVGGAMSGGTAPQVNPGAAGMAGTHAVAMGPVGTSGVAQAELVVAN